MNVLKEFRLIGKDYQAIDLAKHMVHEMLKSPKIIEPQVTILAKSYSALSKLPIVTEGYKYEIVIENNNGTDGKKVYSYIIIFVSEKVISICEGGALSSENNTLWRVEIENYSDHDFDLYNLEKKS